MAVVTISRFIDSTAKMFTVFSEFTSSFESTIAAVALEEEELDTAAAGLWLVDDQNLSLRVISKKETRPSFMPETVNVWLISSSLMKRDNLCTPSSSLQKALHPRGDNVKLMGAKRQNIRITASTIRCSIVLAIGHGNFALLQRTYPWTHQRLLLNLLCSREFTLSPMRDASVVINYF